MREPAAELGPKSRLLLISLAVLALDQWSKSWIETALPPHATRTVIDGLLNLTHVRNTGVAFGMFASSDGWAGRVILSILGVAAMVVVGVYFYKTPLSEKRVLVALALILGGAVGNLLDRVASGAVTDFIDFYVGTYHWHTFNVADSAITVGICLLALDILLTRRAEEPVAS